MCHNVKEKGLYVSGILRGKDSPKDRIKGFYVDTISVSDNVYAIVVTQLGDFKMLYLNTLEIVEKSKKRDICPYNQTHHKYY